MKLRLPVLFSSSNCDEFSMYKDVLEKVADCSDIGVPTKKCPAIGCIEIGSDDVQIGLFYSPLELGKTLTLQKNYQEVVELVVQALIQIGTDSFANTTVNAKKLTKFVNNRMESLFEGEDHSQTVNTAVVQWENEQNVAVSLPKKKRKSL